MPMKVYRDLQTTATPNPAVNVPRNPEKVRNVLKKHRREYRPSQDSFNNILELRGQIGTFLSRLQLVPTVVCELVFDEFLNLARDILTLPEDFSPRFMLSYDTTFNMGNFFVSPLVFRHVYFEDSPIFPMAFLIHDRKLHRDHERFLQDILCRLVERIDRKIPLATDREFTFNSLPNNIVQVYCWRHIINNVERFTSKCGDQAEASHFAAQVSQLMKCVSLEQFNIKLSEFEDQWTPAVSEYFHSNLLSCIVEKAGRWILEPLGIYSPFSGITTNISESMNSVLQRLIEWKRRPMDVCCLALYYLCKYYQLEIDRGMHGQGRYKLRPGTMTPMPIQDLKPAPPGLLNPTEIVPYLQNPSKIVPSDPSDYFPEKLPDLEGQSSFQYETVETEENAASVTTKDTVRFALARSAVRSNKVSCDFSVGIWTVGDTNGDGAFAVSLDPDVCKCGATVTCFHILAARMAAGLPTEVKKRQPSLLKTYMSHKSRSEKKSGRKRPSRADQVIKGKSNDSPRKKTSKSYKTLKTKASDIISVKTKPAQFEAYDSTAMTTANDSAKEQSKTVSRLMWFTKKETVTFVQDHYETTTVVPNNCLCDVQNSTDSSTACSTVPPVIPKNGPLLFTCRICDVKLPWNGGKIRKKLPDTDEKDITPECAIYTV